MFLAILRCRLESIRWRTTWKSRKTSWRSYCPPVCHIFLLSCNFLLLSAPLYDTKKWSLRTIWDMNIKKITIKRNKMMTIWFIHTETREGGAMLVFLCFVFSFFFEGDGRLESWKSSWLDALEFKMFFFFQMASSRSPLIIHFLCFVIPILFFCFFLSFFYCILPSWLVINQWELLKFLLNQLRKFLSFWALK